MKPVIMHPVQEIIDGEINRYGMEYGPVRVIRLAHIPGRGWWLVIQTEHDEMTIHASEYGRRLRAARL